MMNMIMKLSRSDDLRVDDAVIRRAVVRRCCSSCSEFGQEVVQRCILSMNRRCRLCVRRRWCLWKVSPVRIILRVLAVRVAPSSRA